VHGLLQELKYSLRLLLFFANINISTIKIYLDISILAKSIMDLRKYKKPGVVSSRQWQKQICYWSGLPVSSRQWQKQICYWSGLPDYHRKHRSAQLQTATRRAWPPALSLSVRMNRVRVGCERTRSVVQQSTQNRTERNISLNNRRLTMINLGVLKLKLSDGAWSFINRYALSLVQGAICGF
jgi:hypothetical protein